MYSLFNNGNGKFTDMIIHCGKRSWKAHSCILATRCNFFRAGLEGSFQVSLSDLAIASTDMDQESTTKNFWLDDDPPEALGRLLEFLYTLSNTEALSCLNGSRLLIEGVRNLLDLCKVADKYDQPLLLEQIHYIFIPKLGGFVALTMALEHLLMFYKGVHQMGNSPWLNRIRQAVLDRLLRSENLTELTAACKSLLGKNMELAFVLIELLADKCNDYEKKGTYYRELPKSP